MIVSGVIFMRSTLQHSSKSSVLSSFFKRLFLFVFVVFTLYLCDYYPVLTYVSSYYKRSSGPSEVNSQDLLFMRVLGVFLCFEMRNSSRKVAFSNQLYGLQLVPVLLFQTFCDMEIDLLRNLAVGMS